MSVEQAVNDLRHTIDALECLQVGKTTVGKSEVTFLCRWTDEVRWAQIRRRFLCRQGKWQSFIAKSYFPKADKNGELQEVAGWYLAFRSDDLEVALPQIGSLLLAAAANFDNGASFSDFLAVGDAEVVEVPLVGASENRNVYPGKPGKGVRATR